MADERDRERYSSSPTSMELEEHDLLPSPPMPEVKGSYSPDELVYSQNQSDSAISVGLQSKFLWRQFDSIGTEMIVTRRGR